MEEKGLKYWLDLYERTSGAKSYEIGFIFENNLYKIELKKLDISMIRFAKESSKKGGHLKLRIYVNKAKKLEWLASGKARKLMAEQNFLKKAIADNLNKGQEFEKMRTEARGIEYRLDNKRYDKCGDVSLKTKEIQMKFENASLTQCRTMLKAVANA